MKLIIAIVNKDDAHAVCQALRHKEYMFTKLNSTGGFLKENNRTLLIGIEDEKVEDVLREIRANCATRQVEVPLVTFSDSEYYDRNPVANVTVGGATIFVVDAEHFEKM